MSALAVDAPPVRGPAPLELEAVDKAFGEHGVLRGASLALEPGAITALVGASGTGKSLLVRVALGLERVDAGRARLLGADVAALAEPERARLLQRVGVLWSSDALFEGWSVERNVGFALREVQRRPAREVARAVREGLLLVGLKHVEHLAVGALAAGARRRVALARAIAHGPELLLLDEPAAGLDPVGAEAMRELVRQLRTRLGLTVLVATRDAQFAGRVAERMAVLHDGRVAAEGTPDDLLRAPHPAVQQLLGGQAHGPIVP